MSVLEKISKTSNIKIFFNNFNNIFGIKTFDVTLRDGLQSVSKSEEKNYDLENKEKILEYIKYNYNPTNIELGSIVSPNVLPILKDSVELYKKYSKKNNNGFLLIPNKSKLKIGINNGVNNFSFITSVSESFQKKNTKKSLEENKSELIEMMYEIFSNEKILNPIVKLYISCINECPIEGEISLNKITNEIKFYQERIKPDIICLSDTCGSLEVNKFIEIVESCKYNNIDFDKLSLHLHVKNEEITKQVINIALHNNIKMFDVSLIESGGCSVTMGKENTNRNLSYNLLAESIIEFLIDKNLAK